MATGSEPPASKKSTARVLLLGCAGLVALCFAAFIVLVVVRAVRIGSAPAETEEPVSETAIETPPPGAYRHPSGCYWFESGEDWELVEETGLGSKYSADAANPLRDAPLPAAAGLWVEAACAPLDKVGTNWIPPLPGVDVIEQERVPFGGGRSILRVLRYESRDGPPLLEIDYSVDRNGSRCGFSVEGGVDAVQRFRQEFERAAASFVCAGR